MISVAAIESALGELTKLDPVAAFNAFKTQNIEAEFATVEQVLDVLSMLWPEAKYVEDVVMLIDLARRLKDAGVWQPGQPEDPAMMKAQGPDNA